MLGQSSLTPSQEAGHQMSAFISPRTLWLGIECLYLLNTDAHSSQVGLKLEHRLKPKGFDSLALRSVYVFHAIIDEHTFFQRGCNVANHCHTKEYQTQSHSSHIHSLSNRYSSLSAPLQLIV